MLRTGSSQRRSALSLRLFSLIAAGCLVLSGCVGGGSSKKNSSGTPPPGKGTGQATPSKSPGVMARQSFWCCGAPLRIDVLSLGRVNPTILKVKLAITDNETDGLGTTLGTNWGGSNADGKSNLSNVALVDEQAMKAYFPLVSKQNNELESGFSESMDAGETLTVSVFYPSPPGNVSKVGLMSPVFPPFSGLRIAPTAQVEKNELDPTKIPLAPSDIENLTSISDDVGGDKSVDESGGEQDVRLNTDVLFALNKATLTKKAGGILKDVAKRIDQAHTATINVDGYTDSSGNDAINNPLSRRRAAAVAGALKKLVTRSGVTFKAAGHGSSDPVASNGTADGRQKNRRVTVTIGK